MTISRSPDLDPGPFERTRNDAAKNGVVLNIENAMLWSMGHASSGASWEISTWLRPPSVRLWLRIRVEAQEDLDRIGSY